MRCSLINTMVFHILVSLESVSAHKKILMSVCVFIMTREAICFSGPYTHYAVVKTNKKKTKTFIH